MPDSTDSGSSFSDLLPWLQFALKVQESQKSGTFKMPPMSPQQQQMFNWAMTTLQGTPSSSAMMLPILGYDLSHPATIDMNALRAGKVGYTPTQHMPGLDLSKIIQGVGSGAGSGGGTPSGPAAGATAGGTGAPNSGVYAPVGSPNDQSSASQPTGTTGNTSGSDPSTWSSGTWQSIRDYASRYGKSVAEIAYGLATGALVMTGKGIMDAYNSFKNQNNQDDSIGGQQDTQENPLNPQYNKLPKNVPRPQWGPGVDPSQVNQSANYMSSPGQVAPDYAGGGDPSSYLWNNPSDLFGGKYAS